MTSIIQIVPKLPPKTNGLGDYALNLARQLRQDFRIQTHFVVGDPNWVGPTQIEAFFVSQVTVHSADNLLTVLSSNSSPVLLHYVNYGYAKRGCPTWLVAGLERWKKNNPNSLVLTMFHELYACGPPWASSFWLSPLQKNLAARLAQLSDRCITNRRAYAEMLYKMSGAKQTPIPVLPVFSNIGEPKQVQPLVVRSRWLVVFGNDVSRTKVYRESLAELNRACQLLRIEEILDIGPSTGITLSPVNNVPIVEMGKLPASEISSIMSDSLAGFLNYDTQYLARSGIFAAYCAHGLLPINSRPSASPTDGIESGKHYLTSNDSTKDWHNWVELQAIATNAYTWYRTHNLPMQADIFAAYFQANIANEPEG